MLSHGPHRHLLLIHIPAYLPQPQLMVLLQGWGEVGVVGVEGIQEVGVEVGVEEGVDM